MRITIFTPSFFPEVNGGNLSLYERIKALIELGCKIQCIAPDYAPLAHLYPHYGDYVGQLQDSLEVVPFAGKTPLEYPMTQVAKPFALQPLDSKIHAFRPEIIHAESPERLFFYSFQRPGVAYAKRFNIPKTAFCHTFYADHLSNPAIIKAIKGQKLLKLFISLGIIKKLIGYSFNGYDLTMAANENIKNYLARICVKNIAMHPFFGVDPKLFTTEGDLFSLPSIYDKKIKILYAGRLSIEKNIQGHLDLYNEILSHPQYGSLCAFLFAGSGPLEATVLSWIAKHSDQALFLGQQQVEAMPALLRSADYLALLSPGESLGLIALESMACGTPVIGNGSGGVGEILRSSKGGIIIDNEGKGQQNRLEEIFNVITSQEKTLELRNAGLAYARQHSWKAAGKAMCDIWQKMLSCT